MKHFHVIVAAILASGASLTALAEPTASANSPATYAGNALPPASAQQADAQRPATPPAADPPAAGHVEGVTGAVLGVDPHARIITVKVDHSTDGIHSGDRIHIDKVATSHKARRRHHPPIHKRRIRPTRTAPQRQSPTQVPSSQINPAAPVPNTAATGNSRPAQENSGSATATLPPAAPAPTTAPNESAEATPPSPSTIPPELGLVPRRSGGYAPGGTAPGGL